jgi:hypothetical protein
MAQMFVVIQKPDLDTCLTALVLGIPADVVVHVAQDRAAPSELCDSLVVCIEAGGSGDTLNNNWDHHDVGGPAEAACAQAFAVHGGDASLERLVEYVAAVDTRSVREQYERAARVPFPSLSALFSGMLLKVSGVEPQFAHGLGLLKIVHDLELDPFLPMPRRKEWTDWLDAKEANTAAMQAVLEHGEVRWHRTKSGRRMATVKTDAFGIVGHLYEQGAEIVIAMHPAFGESHAPKTTIASATELRIADLLRPALTALEPGWGGPASGTIIGSPRQGGTMLSLETLAQIVVDLA